MRGWWRGALAGAIVLGSASAAQASGGVQIDTAAFSTSNVTLCNVGQACGSGYNLGFDVALGNGTSFNTVYIYRQGVIGLGAALPTTATLGDLNSLGGAYIAPSFGDFTGLDVHTTFALAGGMDHGLPPFVNDDVLIDWFVSDPNVLPDHNRGEFQIEFHTGQYGEGGPSFVRVNYGGNLGDPTPGAQGLFWPGDGKPPGALTGSNLSGVAPTPEPATWIMLILGFGVVGAFARRGRCAALAG